MFIGKKDVESLKQEFEQVAGRLRQHNVEVATLQDTYNELQEKMQGADETITKLDSSLQEQVNTLQSNTANLQSEMTEMKLFFSQMKKDLAKDLLADFSNEVKQLTDGITQDLEEFRNLKGKVGELSIDIVNIKGEVSKFNTIAQTIKQADYDLEKYSKVLSSNDQEKLALMQKIDQLERLVAKQRRGHPASKSAY